MQPPKQKKTIPSAKVNSPPRVRSEGYFSGHDKTKLYFQKWEVAEPELRLVITHGHGEHSGSYQRLVAGIKNPQISIYAWDLRGHGQSDGPRGFAAHFYDYISDLQFFLDFLKSKENNWDAQKVILLGHSMGGLIQTVYTINQDKYCKAQVLSAPLWGLALPVPAWKQKSATWLNKWFPKLTLDNEISFEQLTRDPLVRQEYESDPLRHSLISPGVFLGMQEAMKQVTENLQQLKVNTLLQISNTDPIIDFDVVQRLSKASPLIRLQVVPDNCHEIYNDTDRESIFKNLETFFQEQL